MRFQATKGRAGQNSISQCVLLEEPNNHCTIVPAQVQVMNFITDHRYKAEEEAYTYVWKCVCYS